MLTWSFFANCSCFFSVLLEFSDQCLFLYFMLVTFFPVLRSNGIHAPAYAMFGYPSSPPERQGLHRHATCLASTSDAEERLCSFDCNTLKFLCSVNVCDKETILFKVVALSFQFLISDLLHFFKMF